MAMLIAEADTRRALEFAVREHERQQRLAEELAIQRTLSERQRAQTHRAPMRSGGPAAVAPAGLAQTAPLHRQDLRRYSTPQGAPVLAPEHQEALDAQLDYNREWLTRDEAGNTHLARQPLSESGIVPMASAVERGLQSEESTRLVPKTSKQKPMKVRI